MHFFFSVNIWGRFKCDPIVFFSFRHLHPIILHLRHLRRGYSSCGLCFPDARAHPSAVSSADCRDVRRSGGGSDIQRGSTRLHKGCLSSGFPRLLLYNLPRGIADQSLTRSISHGIIYTSVKSTIIKKTIKALPHLLLWNFDQRQRLGRG